MIKLINCIFIINIYIFLICYVLYSLLIIEIMRMMIVEKKNESIVICGVMF